MHYMEGIPIIHNRNTKPGDLVRFKFLNKKITGNIHHLSEAIGIVAVSSLTECFVLVDKNLIESCWIIEIVESL